MLHILLLKRQSPVSTEGIGRCKNTLCPAHLLCVFPNPSEHTQQRKHAVNTSAGQ